MERCDALELFLLVRNTRLFAYGLPLLHLFLISLPLQTYPSTSYPRPIASLNNLNPRYCPLVLPLNRAAAKRAQEVPLE